MAIDRGPWNALVDDDGSNLVGSIWNKAAIKTVVLDPADAAIAAIPAPTSGTWTPTDASGAGLALAGTSRYWTFDKLVMVQTYIQYPVTANGLPNKIGGLPFQNGGAYGSLYSGSAPVAVVYLVILNSTTFEARNMTGVAYTNAQLSGAGLSISGTYLRT